MAATLTEIKSDSDKAAMTPDRIIAVIVGVLYIIGTAAGMLSAFAISGIFDDPDYLNKVAKYESQVLSATLLMVVMGLVLAMVSVLMFPILRRQNDVLAIGYVVFRGALETFTYFGIGFCWLLLVVWARQYTSAGITETAHYRSFGDLLIQAQDPIITAVQDIVVGIGALMLYTAFYRGRLIPRWITVWGIIAALLYFAGGVISIFDVNPQIFLLPLLPQEMVMAVWLIAKGFTASENAAGAPNRA